MTITPNPLIPFSRSARTDDADPPTSHHHRHRHRSRWSRWGVWVTVAASTALLTGCDSATGTTVTSPPTPPPITLGPHSPAADAPALPPATTAPLSEADLTWLNSFNTLTRALLTDDIAPTQTSTPTDVGVIEQHIRGCSRTLTRIGSPSQRLQPVYTRTEQACQHYDKAAACAHTLATGAHGNRQANEAVDCLSAGMLDGGKLLADAKIKSIQIKTASGDL
jgi:hypothetical protein